MSNSLWSHGPQHTRPPCPSPTLGVYSNSCPLSQWCHSTLSSSVIPFSSLPSMFPSIRVFSNEPVLRIRWPKYWSFSISPFNEYLTVWIIMNCGKLLKRWEYQTILPVSQETCMQVKKQQLEPCMEQLIGSGLRKEYTGMSAVTLFILTYMLSKSWAMPGWMSYKLESRLPGEISTATDVQMIPF